VCGNGDVFFAPSVGGFYQLPGQAPHCLPTCAKNTIAQGTYLNFGLQPVVTQGTPNAASMQGPFEESVAGVGAIQGFELSSATSGNVTVQSGSTPGMFGTAFGAGFANLETDTPQVYSFNVIDSVKSWFGW
jgi:hypothetical protein